MRNNIILGNNETGERIYLTSKNKRNTPDRCNSRSIHQSCVNAWSSPKLNNLIAVHQPISHSVSFY